MAVAAIADPLQYWTNVQLPLCLKYNKFPGTSPTGLFPPRGVRWPQASTLPVGAFF